MFFKWCLLSAWHPAQGWVANRHWSGGENEGQKQVGTGPHAEQDSGYCREAQGGLGKGPLKTQHTRRWTAEEVAVPTLGPTRPSRGATRPSVCQGAHSLHLRSPWAESRRRVEWDPLDSQAIWDGMDAVPKREDQRESTSPGEDPQSKGIRSIPWPGLV